MKVGPGARLSVVDDGGGVAPEHLTRLKHRFWRGDGTRSEGSGIGLSIVDRVARAHYGILDVASGPGGKGLCFEIALGPITRDAGSKPRDSSAKHPGCSTTLR